MNALFLERMKHDLQDAYPAFEKTLDQPMYRGLRYHPGKIDEEKIRQNVTVLEKSPFCTTGYYVNQALGHHPYHIAGAFYLQEPSASGAVTVLDVQPGDVVLDLCAAPGGKSTQIAAQLQDGFLVCNEIDARRARVLLSNLERMGVRNFCLTNAETQTLCEELSACFDKVLVDAPCSGEGMMKKHDEASEKFLAGANILDDAV